jgi:hypothetical protein
MPSQHSSFLIQSSHGANGNFELVVPRIGGGLWHLWRNNDDPAFPWHGPGLTFGSADDIESCPIPCCCRTARSWW